MKKLAVVVLFLTCAGSSYGQLFEAWFNGGQSLLSSRNLGSTVPATSGGSADDFQFSDSGFRFSFRIAFNGDGHFGHEVQYAYSRTHLLCTPCVPQDQGGMAIHQGGYNFLVYATPEGTRVRPFATGGVLFANYVPPGSSATSGGGQTKYGFSYGGGVKIKVTQLFGFRFDVRQATTPKPDFGAILFERQGWLRMNEISAGIGVGF